ncbi:MAG TPA: PAS domain-containing protein, partial [Spirochaetota bacterium]|nr:PAS domain-containing protein [Spirochaetota bacterium]
MNIFKRQIKKLKRILPDRESMSGYSMGTWTWDRKTDRFTLENFWKDKLGYYPGTGVDQNDWRAIVHPADLQELVKNINSTESDFIEMELRLKTHSDSWIWIFFLGKITSRKNGIPYRSEGVILDITKQKRLETEYNSKKIETEALYEESEAQNEEMAAMMDELQRNQMDLEEINEKLKKNEARFRQVFDYAPMGIIQATLEGGILNANNSFIKYFRYDSLDDLKNSVKNSRQFYRDGNLRDSIVSRIGTEGMLHL